MRFLVLSLIFATTASAQTNDVNAEQPCALELNNEVRPSIFCERSGESLTRDDISVLFWAPAVSPLVEASPEAIGFARTYERTRAPRLIGALSSAALLVLSATLNDDARPYVYAGAAVSLGVGYLFDSKGNRARREAISVYNDSLER